MSQVQWPEASVCGGVYPPGNRGRHGPVIHMVVVTVPARAQPISARLLPSLAVVASQGRRGEKKGSDRGMMFVCLLACFVLFRGFC